MKLDVTYDYIYMFKSGKLLKTARKEQIRSVKQHKNTDQKSRNMHGIMIMYLDFWSFRVDCEQFLFLKERVVNPFPSEGLLVV